MSTTERAARRIVLLASADDGEVEKVLREYAPPEPTGTRLHVELKELAETHAGRTVAAEWLGPLGWTRFLWCKR
jgi:hypothetical protein